MIDDIPSQLVDEFNHIFSVKEELARGGQGVVYRLEDPDLAAKISLEQSKKQQYLKALRYVPFPDNICITMPLSLLESGSGYIMRLLADMRPVSWFRREMPKPEDWQPASHLMEVCGDSSAAWAAASYVANGGLQKRLSILASASATLARLHAEGLCYGDISPNNLFFHPDKAQSWWIDPDNIAFDREKGLPAVYTPRFAAPEIVRGETPNSCSGDVFSMAVLAHLLLTDMFPFDGALVEQGGGWWSDGQGNGEELMERGEFPWVFDWEDDRNAAGDVSPGINYILNKSLAMVFHQIFGSGRNHPEARPSMLKLSHAFVKAYAECLTCQNNSCGLSWYASNVDIRPGHPLICPFCKAEIRPWLSLKAFMCVREDHEMGEMVRPLLRGKDLIVPYSMGYPYIPEEVDLPLLTLSLTEAALMIRIHDDASYYYEPERGRRVVMGENLSVSLDDAVRGLTFFNADPAAYTIHLQLTL